MSLRYKTYRKMRNIGKKISIARKSLSVKRYIGRKAARNELIERNSMQNIYSRFYHNGIIDILVHLGIHKNITATKIILLLISPIIVFFIDGFLVGMIIFSLNVLICAVIFWSLVDSERKRDTLESRYSKVVAILIAIFINIIMILFSHYYISRILHYYIYN